MGFQCDVNNDSKLLRHFIPEYLLSSTHLDSNSHSSDSTLLEKLQVSFTTIPFTFCPQLLAGLRKIAMGCEAWRNGAVMSAVVPFVLPREERSSIVISLFLLRSVCHPTHHAPGHTQVLLHWYIQRQLEWVWREENRVAMTLQRLCTMVAVLSTPRRSEPWWRCAVSGWLSQKGTMTWVQTTHTLEKNQLSLLKRMLQQATVAKVCWLHRARNALVKWLRAYLAGRYEFANPLYKTSISRNHCGWSGRYFRCNALLPTLRSRWPVDGPRRCKDSKYPRDSICRRTVGEL